MAHYIRQHTDRAARIPAVARIMTRLRTFAATYGRDVQDLVDTDQGAADWMAGAEALSHLATIVDPDASVQGNVVHFNVPVGETHAEAREWLARARKLVEVPKA